MKINGIFRHSVVQQLPNNRQLRVETGYTNNKNIKIYSLYDKNKLQEKLYYVTTDLKNWYATKLKIFEEGKVTQRKAYKRLDREG